MLVDALCVSAGSAITETEISQALLGNFTVDDATGEQSKSLVVDKGYPSLLRLHRLKEWLELPAC